MPTLLLMPFGKHKNKPLHTLPQGYLSWLKTIDLDPQLAASVDRAIRGEPCYVLSQQEKILAGRNATLERLRKAESDPQTTLDGGELGI